MHALYVRQRCLTLRSAPVPVAVFGVAPKPFPKRNGFTSSLNPAFSPRRRSNARRLLEKPATGLVGQSSAKPESFNGLFLSPGERIKGEGERQQKLSSRLAAFVHRKLPLAGAGARPPLGTLPGSAPVPVAVSAVAPKTVSLLGSTAALGCRVRRPRRTLFARPMFPAGALETTREGACAPPRSSTPNYLYPGSSRRCLPRRQLP